MGYLDFIANRNASQQQPVAEKSQQPQWANTKPLSPVAQAKADAVALKLERATRYVDAGTRPKLAARPEVKWPRNPPSWER
jgi:hypothetical protein